MSDAALGGGYPKGRVIEIYGPESSGKTTICQHIVAEAQRLGGTAAFVDMEHALDPVYAEQCGVDVENLLISQPDTGEQALEIAETLVRSGAVDVLVNSGAISLGDNINASADRFAGGDVNLVIGITPLVGDTGVVTDLRHTINTTSAADAGGRARATATPQAGCGLAGIPLG